MKKFLAIYIGTTAALESWKSLPAAEREAKEKQGMQAWMDWGERNAAVIVDNGNPLGKTKRIAGDGISDIHNAMTGYTIIQADSHEAAAKLFEGHPHFTLFPGDSVEVMECLPLPKQP